MSHLGKRIILFVLVLAVVIVASVLWWKKGAGDNVRGNVSTVSQANQASETQADLVSLSVDDQFPGGLVFVSSVDLPRGGWVVIKRNEGGVPGVIIGAGYFGPKVLTGEVNLSTPSKEGEEYFALLYHDNGDIRFDPKIDQPYRNDQGQVVSIGFRVTKNLPEKKG